MSHATFGGFKFNCILYFYLAILLVSSVQHYAVMKTVGVLDLSLTWCAFSIMLKRFLLFLFIVFCLSAREVKLCGSLLHMHGDNHMTFLLSFTYMRCYVDRFPNY